MARGGNDEGNASNASGIPAAFPTHPAFHEGTDRLEFGDRAPRLAPRTAPSLRAPPGRPIGLKGEDVPRPWTLRRVIGMLFLPKR